MQHIEIKEMKQKKLKICHDIYSCLKHLFYENQGEICGFDSSYDDKTEKLTVLYLGAISDESKLIAEPDLLNNALMNYGIPKNDACFEYSPDPEYPEPGEFTFGITVKI